MRESEKRRELLKASRLTVINDPKVSLQCLLWGFYSQIPIQITKITKQTLLQWGQIGKTIKSDKKVKKKKLQDK